MKERLIWVLAHLQKLQDEDRIRSEGNQIFQEAKQELESVIAVADVAAPSAPETLVAMTPAQVVDLLSRVDGMAAAIIAGQKVAVETVLAAMPAGLMTPAQVEAVAAAWQAELDRSAAEIIAALKPAPAAAPPGGEPAAAESPAA